MRKADFGIVGLGVMGASLAKNLADNGFVVAVYDYYAEALSNFADNNEYPEQILCAGSYYELAEKLSLPRNILIMVKAGQPVDDVIKDLLPYLNCGDVLIDGGNSFYKDTVRRTDELSEKNIIFMGVGVSGGESGARYGACIMAGGSKEAWKQTKEKLEAVSAKVNGEPCAAHMNGNGAGHYVKMIHNGIEYAIMQQISEVYSILRDVRGLKADDISCIFEEWNKGMLQSFLIEITAHVLKKKDDESGANLVDLIKDSAGQKGTGMLTAIEALENGRCGNIIAEAVFDRNISAEFEGRQTASVIIRDNSSAPGDLTALSNEDLEKALYAAEIITYAQGMELISKAAGQNGWNIDLAEVASIWRGGCIIRSALLDEMREYDFKRNLLLSPVFSEKLSNNIYYLRKVVSEAIMSGIPAGCLNSALSYYDSLRSRRLGTNLIQAQRDYFGAHTYERLDKEGIYHTKW